MATNLDILIGNDISSMYSENTNEYMETCRAQMFEEMKEDEN